MVVATWEEELSETEGKTISAVDVVLSKDVGGPNVEVVVSTELGWLDVDEMIVVETETVGEPNVVMVDAVGSPKLVGEVVSVETGIDVESELVKVEEMSTTQFRKENHRENC